MGRHWLIGLFLFSLLPIWKVPLASGKRAVNLWQLLPAWSAVEHVPIEQAWQNAGWEGRWARA